jgi:hypothetical protein
MGTSKQTMIVKTAEISLAVDRSRHSSLEDKLANYDREDLKVNDDLLKDISVGKEKLPRSAVLTG